MRRRSKNFHKNKRATGSATLLPHLHHLLKNSLGCHFTASLLKSVEDTGAKNGDADFHPLLANMGCPAREFLNFLNAFPRPRKLHDIKKVQDIVPVVPAQGLSATVDPSRFLVFFLFEEPLPAYFPSLLSWIVLDFLGFLRTLDDPWGLSHFHPLQIFFHWLMTASPAQGPGVAHKTLRARRAQAAAHNRCCCRALCKLQPRKRLGVGRELWLPKTNYPLVI